MRLKIYRKEDWRLKKGDLNLQGRELKGAGSFFDAVPPYHISELLLPIFPSFISHTYFPRSLVCRRVHYASFVCLPITSMSSQVFFSIYPSMITI
ncbi:hypothetical protein ACSAZL_03310 [Methanosarcina sp. T3]|uniref:hypothetical protein n=1 Tax=Methanosarcina sp. T3 TaxID=3439062 RepID=UPI003F872FE0